MGDPHLKEVYEEMSTRFDKQRTQTYFHELTNYLQSVIPSKSTVLEIGSGTGGYCIELSKHGCSCKGADYSEKMVAVAKENNRVAHTHCIFKVADVEQEIPFREKFDFVISMDSWEFFPHPGAVMRNVYNALKDNSLFIIITPNMLFAPAIILAERLHVKKLSPAYTYFNSFKRKVSRLAKENSFLLEKKGYIFHSMSVIYTLRKKAKEYDHPN